LEYGFDVLSNAVVEACGHNAQDLNTLVRAHSSSNFFHSIIAKRIKAEIKVSQRIVLAESSRNIPAPLAVMPFL